MSKASESVQSKLGLAAGLIVIGMVAVGAWYTTDKPVNQQNNNQSLTASNSSMQAVGDACKESLNEESLCTFFARQSSVTKVLVRTVGKSEGSELTSTIVIDGNNSWLKAEGAINYEIINIGTTTYTKGGETWWKSATKNAEPLRIGEFTYPIPSAEALQAKQITFEAQGKEACGDMECYKYAITDPATGTTPTTVWFDTQDYLLRKSSVTATASSSNDQTFSYENVQVPQPDPVKDLTENQYIIPGQSEPVEAPAASQ